MRNNITSKKVPLPPWLAAFLGFSLAFPSREDHTPFGAGSFFHIFAASTSIPSATWGTAYPQGCCRVGLITLAPKPAPKPAILQVFSGPIPLPVGRRVWMCASVLQQMLCRGSWCTGHVVGANPIFSTMYAASEDPSHDSLLTESSRILRWPPQNCFSVGTRQGPWLDQFGVPIPMSFLRMRHVLALSELVWTNSSGSHWQSCFPRTCTGQGCTSYISWTAQ